jgi:hypothetical protein
MWSIMRLPGNLVARIAPMNLKMRKCLIINDHFLRFMGRIADTLRLAVENHRA